MKFTITFKDPDGVFEGVNDVIKHSTRSVSGFDSYELNDYVGALRRELTEEIGGWVKYDEYITI